MSKEERGVDCVYRLSLCSADVRESWTELLRRSHPHETQFDGERGYNCLEVLHRLGGARVIGIPYTAARSSSGVSSLSSCSRLELRSTVVIIESPVTFPPGCARLLTRPDPTGSRARAMTMGILDVDRLATSVATVLSRTITSTLLRTKSAISPGTRS